MKIFIKNKPKKTVLNMLYILGIMGILINILALSTFVLWIDYPNTVSKIDRAIPIYYVYKVKALQLISKKSPSNGLRYFFKIQLYKELKEISILHKYYNLRQEVAVYLIDYNIKNKNLEKALEIAEDWERRYPYDFFGKSKYIEVLYLVDRDKLNRYYKKLYHRYGDIKEIEDGYKLYLESIE